MTVNCTIFGVLVTVYYLGDQIKKNEMGRACGMCGVGDFYTGFWRGTLKKRDLLEGIGLKRNNIKTDLKEIVWEGVGAVIDLAQDRAK